jgi:hypothetical protein
MSNNPFLDMLREKLSFGVSNEATSERSLDNPRESPAYGFIKDILPKDSLPDSPTNPGFPINEPKDYTGGLPSTSSVPVSRAAGSSVLDTGIDSNIQRIISGQEPINSPKQPQTRSIADVGEMSPEKLEGRVQEAVANELPFEESASTSTEMPSEDRISKLLKMMKPTQSTMNIPADATNIGTDADMKAAMAARDKEIMMNRVGAGLNQMGTAIAHQTADNKFYDEGVKLAGLKTEDLQKRIENQKNDPKSQYSAGAREFAKKFGITIPDNLSGAVIEKNMPYIIRAYDSDQDNKARIISMVERENDRKALSAEKKSEKNDAMTVKRFDDMGKKIAAEIGSSRSAFGKSANVIRSGEAIETLIKQVDNPNKLDTRQIQEIARNLDAMLASGQPTISGTAKLVPNTFRGSASKIAEYITNMPKGAQQGEFVKRMAETVSRELDLAKDQIKRSQGKILGSYSDLRNKDPDKWNLILKQHDLDPDLFDGSSSKEMPKKEDTGKDADAEKYAKMHNLSYDQALKIIQLRKSKLGK